MRIHQPHREVGVPGEGAVDGPLSQDLAVDAVGGVGGDGADHVGRV